VCITYMLPRESVSSCLATLVCSGSILPAFRH
jgi:hypothetical protein